MVYIQPAKNQPKFLLNQVGTLDIETFCLTDGQYVPYCAVIYFNNNLNFAYRGDIVKIKIGSNHLVLTDPIAVSLAKLIIAMRAANIKSALIFVHNLSGLKGLFLLKSFVVHGWHAQVIWRDGHILQIILKLGHTRMEFRCSYLLLNASLVNCALHLGIEHTKLPFNHEWVTVERLNYIGPIPDVFNTDEYNIEEFTTNFNFRDYALRYCINNCILLFDILVAFDTKLGESNISIRGTSLTIPSLAFKVFKETYLKPNMVENLSRSVAKEDFVRNAYYGGRCEVFRGHISENGFYYDVPGMYAYAMSQHLPVGPTR